MMNISKQVKTLGEYLLSSPVHPPSFCLGAFAHPQAFLACVLMDHARSAMKSVYALEFSVEVSTCLLFLNELHRGSAAEWLERLTCISEAPSSRPALTASWICSR